MTDTASQKKQKKLRIGFYTSTTGNKTTKSNAQIAFDTLYNSYVNADNNSYATLLKDKKLKIVFLNKDNDAKFYFGYISCSREGFHLPYIGDEHWNEESIPLDDTNYLVERSHFLYYYESDILILTQNHIGPKESDLAFILFNASGTPDKPVSFSAIWKQESVKELLETGSTLRSCQIIMAAPRNFNASTYDLSSTFSKQLIEMMAGQGGSTLNLTLRGRASNKKLVKGYLSDEVKSGLKELLEKMPTIMRKATISGPKENKTKSLLDQVLVSEKYIYTIRGYGEDHEVRKGLISAKIEHAAYLNQYDINNK
ncbi:hypothetical protein EXT60_18425 [Pectobacterium carotovorum subsp. carotovorum]|uniref:DUF6731 family protein n=1 Tax=Pectobacterium carotovorum TaxID=554 RepID=UPI00202DB237|nr:DUF6731 family protein [Pectobacterium carotovorum]MCL6366208.1 hypothetical protein [Pectobacterium carotovorum subsp. carotovorum]